MPAPADPPRMPGVVTLLPIATVAANEYRKRQQRAGDIVRDGGMMASTATGHLRPWLAIACLCGADLADLVERIADWRQQDTLGQWNMTEAEARWLVADQICPRPHWVPVLTAARDDAFNRYLADSTNGALTSAAAALQRLCLHLQYDPNGCHVPNYRAPAVAERSAAERNPNPVAEPPAVAERSEAEPLPNAAEPPKVELDRQAA